MKQKLAVEKVVEGDATVAQKFEFSLKADANNPTDGATLPDPAKATVNWELSLIHIFIRTGSIS